MNECQNQLWEEAPEQGQMCVVQVYLVPEANRGSRVPVTALLATRLKPSDKPVVRVLEVRSLLRYLCQRITLKC